MNMCVGCKVIASRRSSAEPGGECALAGGTYGVSGPHLIEVTLVTIFMVSDYL